MIELIACAVLCYVVVPLAAGAIGRSVYPIRGRGLGSYYAEAFVCIYWKIPLAAVRGRMGNGLRFMGSLFLMHPALVAAFVYLFITGQGA